MKLVCWNINSLVPTVRNAVLKYGSWPAFFQQHSIDILCLQEVKLNEDKLSKEVCCVEGFQTFWATSRERKGYSGVATYASDAYAPLTAESDCLGSGEEDIDREGRVVITDHHHFVLINVYVPNAGDPPHRPRLGYKLRFLEALKRKADGLTAAGREVMLVGDFNVPAEPRDIHPALGQYNELYSEEERAVLAGLMASYPDAWRRLHPDETSTYTVWDEKTSARAFNQGLRIDYVLASPGLLGRVVSCEVLSSEVLPPKWSDHAGIQLELRDVPPLPPHPPCSAWLRLNRRFNDTSQRSIMAMFGKNRAAPAAAAVAAAAAAAAAAPEDGPAAGAAGGSGGEETAVRAGHAMAGAPEDAAGAGPAPAAAAVAAAGTASAAQQEEGPRKRARLSSGGAAPAAGGGPDTGGAVQSAGQGGSRDRQAEAGGGACERGSPPGPRGDQPQPGQQQQQQQQAARSSGGSATGEAGKERQQQQPGRGSRKPKQRQQQQKQQPQQEKQKDLAPGQRTIGSFFASKGS